MRSVRIPNFPRNRTLWEILDGIRIWDAFGIRVPKSWKTEVPSAKSSFEGILKDPFYDVMGDNGARLKGLPPLFVAVGGLEHVENQINAAKALAKTCKEVGGGGGIGDCAELATLSGW